MNKLWRFFKVGNKFQRKTEYTFYTWDKNEKTFNSTSWKLQALFSNRGAVCPPPGDEEQTVKDWYQWLPIEDV